MTPPVSLFSAFAVRSTPIPLPSVLTMPGIDGEQVPAERIVPDAKEYISETIDDPETIFDPKIWDTPGFALVLSWLAQKWQRRCHKLAPRGSKKLTEEQQKACLDSAAAELIREITHGRSLN
jgi:hypothetical protein